MMLHVGQRVKSLSTGRRGRVDVVDDAMGKSVGEDRGIGLHWVGDIDMVWRDESDLSGVEDETAEGQK